MWVLQNKSSIVYLQAGNMQQYLEANALNSAKQQPNKQNNSHKTNIAGFPAQMDIKDDD